VNYDKTLGPLEDYLRAHITMNPDNQIAVVYLAEIEERRKAGGWYGEADLKSKSLDDLKGELAFLEEVVAAVKRLAGVG
jgi:hypothetical protein